MRIGLRPGSLAAYIRSSVTASRPLQFASRCAQLFGGNGRAAPASGRGTGRAAYTKDVMPQSGLLGAGFSDAKRRRNEFGKLVAIVKNE